MNTKTFNLLFLAILETALFHSSFAGLHASPIPNIYNCTVVQTVTIPYTKVLFYSFHPVSSFSENSKYLQLYINYLFMKLNLVKIVTLLFINKWLNFTCSKNRTEKCYIKHKFKDKETTLKSPGLGSWMSLFLGNLFPNYREFELKKRKEWSWWEILGFGKFHLVMWFSESSSIKNLKGNESYCKNIVSVEFQQILSSIKEMFLNESNSNNIKSVETEKINNTIEREDQNENYQIQHKLDETKINSYYQISSNKTYKTSSSDSSSNNENESETSDQDNTNESNEFGYSYYNNDSGSGDTSCADGNDGDDETPSSSSESEENNDTQDESSDDENDTEEIPENEAHHEFRRTNSQQQLEEMQLDRLIVGSRAPTREEEEIINDVVEDIVNTNIQMNDIEEHVEMIPIKTLKDCYHICKYPLIRVKSYDKKYQVCLKCLQVFRSHETFRRHCLKSGGDKLTTEQFKLLSDEFDRNLYYQQIVNKNIWRLNNNHDQILISKSCDYNCNENDMTVNAKGRKRKEKRKVETNNVSQNHQNVVVQQYPIDKDTNQFYFTSYNIRNGSTIDLNNLCVPTNNYQNTVEILFNQEQMNYNNQLKTVILKNMFEENMNQDDILQIEERVKVIDRKHFKTLSKEEITCYKNEFMNIIAVYSQQQHTLPILVEISNILITECNMKGKLNNSKYILFIILAKTMGLKSLVDVMIDLGYKEVTASMNLSKEQSKIFNQYNKLLMKHVFNITISNSYETLLMFKRKRLMITSDIIDRLLEQSSCISISIDASLKRHLNYYGCYLRICTSYYVMDIPFFLKQFTARGEGLGKQLVDELFEKILELKEYEHKITSTTSDGDSSMNGFQTGFMAEIEKRLQLDKCYSVFQSNHCYLHRIQLTLADLKNNHIFKAVYMLAETITEEKIRDQYYEFLEELTKIEPDEEKRLLIKHLKEIPILSNTRFSYSSETMTAVLNHYDYIYVFVQNNVTFWNSYKKRMLKKISAKESEYNDGTTVVTGIFEHKDDEDDDFSDDENILSSSSPSTLSKEEKMIKYLNKKFNSNKEFLNLKQGICNINLASFKQTFIMSTYLLRLVHTIAKYLQNQNLLVTTCYEIVYALEEFMINIYNSNWDLKKWCDCPIFSDLKKYYHIDKYNQLISDNLFKKIIESFIYSLKSHFVTPFHQYNSRKTAPFACEQPLFEVKENISSLAELKRCRLNNYLKIFYYPYFSLNDEKNISINEAMFNDLKEELNAVDFLLNRKKDELIQSKLSNMGNLMIFLECKVYLSLEDIIKYLPKNQFPKLTHVFEVIVSISPVTSLVEKLFSVAGNKYKPNISYDTIEINTLFSLYKHVKVKQFN